MKKPSIAFVASLVAVALSMPVARAQQATSQPPVAAKKPHSTEIHGYKLNDDYFWLREKDSPEVTKYLEAENAYTDDVMKPTKAFQETLYNEMLGRIKQTDLSVPYRIGDYCYYSRTEEGKQYPYMCRRKGSMEGRRRDPPRPQQARRRQQVYGPRRVYGQRRWQLARVFDRHDRLSAVQPARERPAQRSDSRREHRARGVGRLGHGQQDAVLLD